MDAGTLTEPEVIGLRLPEEAPPCAWWECDRGAAWVVRGAHCDGGLCVPFLLCEEHAEVERRHWGPYTAWACRPHHIRVQQEGELWIRL